jgi:hypothetical protein
MYSLKLIVAGVLLALAAGAGLSSVAKAGGPAAPSAAPPIPSPTSTRKIDEYGDISFNDEKARLDNFAIELTNWPEATGYIIAYGGRRGREGEARRRMERAKRYLLTSRRVAAAQLVTIDGGYRQELTVELYVNPPDMTPPSPSPTVDPAEVEIIKERPKVKRPARKPLRRN